MVEAQVHPTPTRPLRALDLAHASCNVKYAEGLLCQLGLLGSFCFLSGRLFGNTIVFSGLDDVVGAAGNVNICSRNGF